MSSTNKRGPSAAGFPSDLGAAVVRLRKAVDELVVAQEDAKLGLLLALIARAHAYLEGPPGCGKTLLAEGVARLVAARRHVVAFHRDTRETDLLGDAVLRRSRGEGPAGPSRAAEQLRIETAPGPLLNSEVLVLEDLSRAPGEALGPLLQILGARRALGAALPLETAIATAPPDAFDTPTDPLEPGQLDRFAVQVRLQGVVQRRQWWAAQELIRRASEGTLTRLQETDPVITAAQRTDLQQLAAGLVVPSEVLAAYAEWLRRVRLAAARAGGSAPVLLSDRAFGRAALQLLRAHAVLRGSTVVQLRDLRALRLMVARRLPRELLDELQELTEELVREAKEVEQEMQVPAGGSPAPSWLEPDELASATRRDDESEQAQQAVGEIGEQEDEEIEDEPLQTTRQKPADVERLLDAFVGRIERGRHDPDNDPGGQPRSYRPLQRLDELMDGDLVEALLFTQCRLPGQPRTYRRTRRNAGGAVVILRDVSSSMAGQRNAWAGEVVAGLVKVAARRRMRVGYIEFHHRALPRDVAGRLLHRAYPRLFELAASAHPLGQTNYEEPLALALDSLRGRRGRNRHVVMLTDGLPITGDTRVLAERRLAQRLGVSLHTVFIGEGECPLVLDDISRETGGLRFQATPSQQGLQVTERG